MKFAKRMERMQSSEIRELLKLTAQPDIICLLYTSDAADE